MLRYHAGESDVAKKLLARYGSEIELPPARLTKPIQSLGRLEQSILMLGPFGVGKTSFLFASEALCGSPEKTEPGAPYPPIAIEPVRSACSDAKRNRFREERRAAWQKGDESKDENISMAARAGPKRLCSYRLLDTIGELVVARHEEGDARDAIDTVIRRLRDPGIVALMVDARGHDDKRVTKGIVDTARRVTELLGRRTPARIPTVYLIVNKLDERLNETNGEDDAVDAEAVAALVEEANRKVFDLSPYLGAGHAHGMLRPPAWTERVLDWIRADAGLTKSLGMREMILENVKRWNCLLWAVAEAGVDEVYLTFASSLPDQSGNADRATPSVNAFWRHVWGPRQHRLEAALATHARSVFCNQARTDAMAALNLAREGTGLRIAAGPDADGILEAETATGAADGADIRRSVKLSPMERGRGLDTVLASLSSEHRRISEWRDRTIERIERLTKDWESLLTRAVAELNLDSAWPCAELRPEQLSARKTDNDLREWIEKRRRFDSNEGEADPQKTTSLGGVRRDIANALHELAAGRKEGDFDAKAIRIVMCLRARLEATGKEVDDEYWAERHRLKQRDVDGYFGSLRGGSLLADAWPWPDAAIELSEWLAKGEGTSVGERIGDEVRNAGEDGLRPQTRAFLWQLADHGAVRRRSSAEDPGLRAVCARKVVGDRTAVASHPRQRPELCRRADQGSARDPGFACAHRRRRTG